jgi:hypothetical protein
VQPAALDDLATYRISSFLSNVPKLLNAAFAWRQQEMFERQCCKERGQISRQVRPSAIRWPGIDRITRASAPRHFPRHFANVPAPNV